MKGHPSCTYLKGFAITVIVLLSACTRPSYIHVVYTPPAASDGVEGRTVYLRVNDQRDTDAVFSEKAGREFEYFTGIYSLSVDAGEKKTISGPLDLNQLFLEALKTRLQRAGMKVMSEPEAHIPVIEIVLKRFYIDRKGRNWETVISYDARLINSGDILATQKLTGNAERMKLLGTRDAEKILGEIFTEMINKLDGDKLFSEADL